MGPGFHAFIEESLFGTAYPEILFWNQPKVNSFSELITSAEKILLDLHSKTQKKIALKAHSFGAIISYELIKLHPEKIESLTMLNSSNFPFNCFLNLSSLEKSEKQQLLTKTTQEKMDFIFKLASLPNFNERYWFSTLKMQDYLALAAKFPSLDFETFSKVFSTFLDTKSAKDSKFSTLTWNGKVTIFTSQDDALIKLPDDINEWLKIFPQAKLEYISGSGHYSLFEDSNLPHSFFS